MGTQHLMHLIDKGRMVHLDEMEKIPLICHHVALVQELRGGESPCRGLYWTILRL